MRNWARTTFDWRKVADSWDAALTSQTADTVPDAPAGTAAQEKPRRQSSPLTVATNSILPSNTRRRSSATTEPSCSIRGMPRLTATVASFSIFFSKFRRLERVAPKPSFSTRSLPRHTSIKAMHSMLSISTRQLSRAMTKPFSSSPNMLPPITTGALFCRPSGSTTRPCAAMTRPSCSHRTKRRHTTIEAALCWFCNRYEAAVQSLDKAILLNPEYAEAHNNRGNALQSLARFQEALQSFDKAILFNPDYADAHCNRANDCWHSRITRRPCRAMIRPSDLDRVMNIFPGRGYT